MITLTSSQGVFRSTVVSGKENVPLSSDDEVSGGFTTLGKSVLMLRNLTCVDYEV